MFVAMCQLNEIYKMGHFWVKWMKYFGSVGRQGHFL